MSLAEAFSSVSIRRSLLGVVAASVLGAACVQAPPPVSTASGQKAAEQVGGQAKLAAGEDVLGARGLSALEVQGHQQLAKRSIVDVVGQPFTQAVRVEVLAKPDNPWELQLGATSSTAIAEGDTLLVSFYVRTQATGTAVGEAETGEGKTEVVFELNEAPHEKAASHTLSVGRQWQKISVPFVAKRAFAPGQSHLVFRLGFSTQTLDFAEVKVENFRQTTTVDQLPKTRTTYEGMQPDAPWRAAAAERIDRLRRANLAVEVVDANGEPVANAEVHARLIRHEFLFGTCAPADHLVNPGHEKYTGLLEENFNGITLENDLKWQPLAGDWEPEFTMSRAAAGVDWGLSRDLLVRGHVLVWPGWRNLPKRLQALKNDPAKLRSETLAHIEEMVTAMKGKLHHWDVVNEPFTNHELIDLLGNEEMIEWFKLARKLDPKAKLFINDFAILNGGGGTTTHRDHYEKMIRLLVEGGAPLDGVGLQAHFGSGLTSPEDLYGLLDRYSQFGQELAITEYDIVINDEQLAADYSRDFYTLLFSHPAVKTIVMWGFWDKNHWKKNAVMYRDDWSIKPAGEVYRDLVFEQWSTDTTGRTNASGQFDTRGYKGLYTVEVTTATGKREVQTTLSDSSGSLRVQL